MAWTAIWVGTLTALAVGLIIGLVGFAIGAHEVSQYVDWKKVRLVTLVFDIGGAFFAFVDGSVHFMAYSAGNTVIPRMATIAGGEEVPAID